MKKGSLIGSHEFVQLVGIFGSSYGEDTVMSMKRNRHLDSCEQAELRCFLDVEWKDKEG